MLLIGAKLMRRILLLFAAHPTDRRTNGLEVLALDSILFPSSSTRPHGKLFNPIDFVAAAIDSSDRKCECHSLSHTAVQDTTLDCPTARSLSVLCSDLIFCPLATLSTRTKQSANVARCAFLSSHSLASQIQCQTISTLAQTNDRAHVR